MSVKIKNFGGKWTTQKLDAFEKYVQVYLTIMNKNRDKYNWKLIYFDGFAGSGINEIEIETEKKLLFDIEPNEILLYKGAAERVLKIEKRGFDYYYFINKDEDAHLELQNKLSKIKHQGKLEFRLDDANNQIQELSKYMSKKKSYTRALVLLDPFGMQVNWSSIELLKDINVDLWILIPSGVIVNRLLDKKGKLDYKDKLTSFFGLTENEIREHFYQNEINNTIFGDETVTRKQDEPIKRITDLYIKRLKTIFKEVPDQPLTLLNTKGCPIFHFAFASQNTTAKKIATYIIGT